MNEYEVFGSDDLGYIFSETFLWTILALLEIRLVLLFYDHRTFYGRSSLFTVYIFSCAL